MWKAELSDSSRWTSGGISSSCGQQNVKSSGFIVITYHARDITLLISAVFKHRRSSGAQTLSIFLGGRFWTKADEFYWTHSQGAAQKFLPFSRNIQSLSPSFTSTDRPTDRTPPTPPLWPLRWRKIKIQTEPAKHSLHLPNARHCETKRIMHSLNEMIELWLFYSFCCWDFSWLNHMQANSDVSLLHNTFINSVILVKKMRKKKIMKVDCNTIKKPFRFVTVIIYLLPIFKPC